MNSDNLQLSRLETSKDTIDFLSEIRNSNSNDSKNENSNSTVPLLLKNDKLIEPDESFNKPPMAGPEIDDLDDDSPTSTQPADGIDDGLLFTNNEDKEPDAEDIDDTINTIFNIHPRAGGDGDETDSIPKQPPDYDFGYVPSTIGGERVPDVNVYQHKKTLAQGMMDLALFSANANQLRYVLESKSSHPYYIPSIFLISVSIILQILVGIGLIWNSRYDIKDKKEICVANKINNFTVIGIFIVTIINVFVSAFGVAPQN